MAVAFVMPATFTLHRRSEAHDVRRMLQAPIKHLHHPTPFGSGNTETNRR
jgi:hypothetical protein